MLGLERWHRGVSHFFSSNDSKSKLVSSHVRHCFCNCCHGRHCLQSKFQAVPFQSCFISIIQTPHCPVLQHQLRHNCNEPPKAFFLLKKNKQHNNKTQQPLCPNFCLGVRRSPFIVWFALHVLEKIRSNLPLNCLLAIS